MGKPRPPPTPRSGPPGGVGGGALAATLAATLIAFIVTLLLLAGALAWLAGTESGLPAAASLAGRLSGGRLILDPAGGRLAGPLELRSLQWRDSGRVIELSNVVLDWNPAALLSRRLEIRRLAAARLAFALPPGPEEPARPPASLRLPLAIQVDRLEIGRLEKLASPPQAAPPKVAAPAETAPIEGTLLAEDLSGRFDSDGIQHRLPEFRLRRQDKAAKWEAQVAGEAQVGGDAPFPLSARLGVSGQLEERPFRLDLDARGPLAGIEARGTATGAVEGTLAATLTPFAPQPFTRLRLHLKDVDPAAWVKGAPAARLDVDADLEPRPATDLAVGGPFVVVNRSPGRLDAKALPLARLSGRVDWQGATARFSALDALLPGGGRLSGEGRLDRGSGEFRLRASNLDATALHGKLRPTRLDGPLQLSFSPAGQALEAELADRQYKISTRLRRQGERLDVDSLELAAGDARLTASGHLELDAGRTFATRGELARFDPARFVKAAPAGRINARFEASGSLQPKPVVILDFKLADSRLRGHPLGGRGQAEIAWPQVRKIDLELTAGPNHLLARGAFGQPGDRLAIDLDAPNLTPYGIEGSAAGKLTVGGTLAAPTLAGRLRSPSLGIPSLGRLRGLVLEAEAEAPPGGQPLPDAPLDLDLRLEALDTPEQRGAARDLTLAIAGSRGRHTLRAGATLAGERKLVLAAAGGLTEGSGAPRWEGRLESLALALPAPARNLQLLAPARLLVAGDQWAIGPADLGGPGWQGRLQAEARAGRLHLEIRGQSLGILPAGEGKREIGGRIDARLDAGLEGAWKLAPAAPWQGRLDLAVPDLAWLGPWLGEGWRTAGRLTGKIDVAGSPQAPVTGGRLDGDRLALRLPDQDLRLEAGQLAATLADNRLRIDTLRFDSPLRPPPAPLLAAFSRDPDNAGRLRQLAARPGRLDIGGEVDLGALAAGREGAQKSGRESARLDIRLERLGVLQKPDQWVVISGNGRLGWQEGTLAVTADLEADAGYWELAPLGTPRLGSDVVIKARTGEKPAPAGPELDLEATLDLGRYFYFSGAGLQSRLAGSVRVRAEGDDLPRATGSIRTVGGKFEAYGQRLDIERGILNFQGLVDNPGLNVRAFRRGLAVEAGVEVTGTVEAPVVRLVSEPDLPDAEKLSWLVLGHGSDQAGGNDASILLAAARALFDRQGGKSGGVLQQVQRQLGIDEFSLRQGEIGGSGGRLATSRVAGAGGFSGTGLARAGTGEQIVSVGKRLSSNILLSYEQALGRTGNIVKLTINLSRRLSLVGRAGSDNALDLFYTFSFGRKD